jgi:hypothetical protein
VRIKAPFKVSYDGPFTFRIWGFGLGYLPMGFLGWGYNVRGHYAAFPWGVGWRANKRTGAPEIESHREVQS